MNRTILHSLSSWGNLTKLGEVVVFVVATSAWISLAAAASGDMCTFDYHCLNGGKCMPANDVTDFKHCHCKDGFSGPRCSRYCPYDCKNGGRCTVKPQGNDVMGLEEQTPTYNPADYMCKCFGYFTGKLCEIPYSNCGEQGQCLHGGQCVLGEDMKHQCQCVEGFVGSSCEFKESDAPNRSREIIRKATSASAAILILFGVSLILIMKHRESQPPKYIVLEREELHRRKELSLTRIKQHDILQTNCSHAKRSVTSVIRQLESK